MRSFEIRDSAIRELLDADDLDAHELDDNLRDIRHINALLGWTAFTARAVGREIRRRGATRFTLLDVAGGSADMPLAVARWARRAGITAEIVATDISPTIVAIAARQAAREPAIRVERQDALALSYPAGAFDIALCTLALHHFDPPVAARLLREMARVARRVLVFDVARSRLAYLGAVLLTRAGGMRAMTRHDAPASVRRAYTAAEWRDLAARAGLRGAVVRAEFPFRLALRADGGL